MSRYYEIGCRLRLAGVDGEYEIKEIVGRGSSCVVYRADFVDVQGVCTEHLLKEYNPAVLNLTRTAEGALRANEDEEAAFADGLARFTEGYEKQLQIRRISELKNSTSNIQNIFTDHGTKYIDMTLFHGATYSGVREQSLHDLLRRMKAIAQVVGNYHAAGFLHLDIKPDNIFTIPETCELVMLFDFDSVIEKAAVSTAAGLSCTKRWAAPEQTTPSMRRQICEATDLFPVGEMVFWQLFGRHSTTEERRPFSEYGFDMEVPILEHVNPKVFAGLADLLHHTLCTVAAKRYQSANELITKLDELIPLTDPKEPYLVSTAVTSEAFFIGRDTELSRIHEMLSENPKLFLSGIGGIGKSELAKNYAVRYKDSYDTILFSTYNGSWTFLVGDDSRVQIANFERYDGEKEQDYCARKLRKLAELCDARTLFIIDNLNEDEFSDEEQKLWERLLGLNCKFIFTTRLREWSHPILEIGVMEQRQNLVDLFHTFCSFKDEQQADVDAIIDYVGGHTLTVELIAKQMKAGFSSPAKMLGKLKEHGIAQSGKEKVLSDKDNKRNRMTAFGHISALFDIAQLSEDEQYVLSNMALIPPDGIDAELFADWCELEDFDAVNELANGGWIDRVEDKIKMHPVVAEVALNEIKSTNVWDTFLWSLYYTLLELDELDPSFAQKQSICGNIIGWAIKLDIQAPLLSMLSVMCVPTFFWFDGEMDETAVNYENKVGSIEELLSNIEEIFQHYCDSDDDGGIV